jgi:hypothetical protein
VGGHDVYERCDKPGRALQLLVSVPDAALHLE